jgi:NAD(P)-dependent dehydrogenase (short-subunit alcohol dehydrogenase family)
LIELDDTTIRNLYATREEIRAAGGECFSLQSHLGRMEEINKLVDTVVAKYGRIDILANNAGASPAMKSVLDTDERLWETVMI